MDAIYELKDMLCEELEEYGKKDKLDVGTLEIVDKLAHTIKNLDKIIETYEEDGYSKEGYYEGSYDTLEGGKYARRGRYSREGEMRGTSYARGDGRGRGSNAKRDSMGRYSRDSQSMVHELRELMEDAPDERTRMEFKKFIERIEHM